MGKNCSGKKMWRTYILVEADEATPKLGDRGIGDFGGR
jgi:hypothetical protein